MGGTAEERRRGESRTVEERNREKGETGDRRHSANEDKSYIQALTASNQLGANISSSYYVNEQFAFFITENI